MELKKYMDTFGISGAELAESVGVEPSAISNYRSGIRKPRPEIAIRIVAATKGEVSLSDLYTTERKRGKEK